MPFLLKFAKLGNSVYYIILMKKEDRVRVLDEGIRADQVRVVAPRVI